MRAHIIENGVVTNTIEVESLDFMPNLIEATEGGPGWLYADGVLSLPPTPAPTVQAPQSVTMRQASLALLGADLLDDVEALVATLPRAYQIEWQRASTVERGNQLVEIVRQQKSMTDDQIDELFTTAATL